MMSSTSTHCPPSKLAWALELQQLLEDENVPTDLQNGHGGRLEIVKNFQAVDHRLDVFIITKSLLSPLTMSYVESTSIEVHDTFSNGVFPNIRRFVTPETAAAYIKTFTRGFYRDNLSY